MKIFVSSALAVSIALSALSLYAETRNRSSEKQVWGEAMEPGAGHWKTWAISSGKDYRVPPPPNAHAWANEDGSQ